MAIDKLTEAHERLTQAVEEITTGDDWRAFLVMAARFHTYSPNNVLLILIQRPEATRVAGYRTWQSMGRQVRKGEKGLAVLAPCTYRRKDEGAQAAATPPADPTKAPDDTKPAKVLRGFRVVHVFDVSQTEGDPLPELERPALLEGDAPAELWDQLANQVQEAGFSLERGECNGANGCTSYLTRTVRVRSDVDPAQGAKTLAHELAHVKLHDGTEYATGCRGRAEVEAESVAYLVCEAAGMESTTYSFPYVAGWAQEADVVKATAARVLAAARQIVGEWVPAALVPAG